MLFFVSYGNSCSMEFDNPERPECNNLLSIYQLVSGKTKEVINFIWVFIRLMPLIVHRCIYINFYSWKFEYHMEMTDNLLRKLMLFLQKQKERTLLGGLRYFTVVNLYCCRKLHKNAKTWTGALSSQSYLMRWLIICILSRFQYPLLILFDRSCFQDS